ncbi:hypothetical protein ACLOJK_036044 [Asimina triloba]
MTLFFENFKARFREYVSKSEVWFFCHFVPRDLLIRRSGSPSYPDLSCPSLFNNTNGVSVEVAINLSKYAVSVQSMDIQSIRCMNNPSSLYSSSSNHYPPQGVIMPLSHLHSIRRPSPKRWRRSSSNGLPEKLYVVHPSRFRKLVQELTGDPKFTSRRLREAAPAPLDLVPKRAMLSLQQEYQYADTRLQLQLQPAGASESQPLLLPSASSAEQLKQSDRCLGSFGSFSPTSCSFLLLSPIFSPEAMALLEQRAVP